MQSQKATRDRVLDEFKLRARTFKSEPREEAWAKQEEGKINSAATATLPKGANIESVACRTSLCKFEIAFPSLEDQRPFGQGFSHAMDSEGILGYHFEQLDQRTDGTYPLEILIFRRGYPMPGLSGTE
jgi:hypothetical protein